MKNVFRYIAGLILGVLIMTMGRYKIHGYHVLILGIIILVIMFDIINEKRVK
jgi:hypothetical protein